MKNIIILIFLILICLETVYAANGDIYTQAQLDATSDQQIENKIGFVTGTRNKEFIWWRLAYVVTQKLVYIDDLGDGNYIEKHETWEIYSISYWDMQQCIIDYITLGNCKTNEVRPAFFREFKAIEQRKEDLAKKWRNINPLTQEEIDNIFGEE